MNTAQDNDFEGLDIAIIGMSGRFPGASNVTTLWENIRDGVESIRPLTADEVVALGEDLANDPTYIKSVAFLDEIDHFDAAFFGIPPKEAELIDPQHRLFLECAWEALEDAGYATESCDDVIGVYAGSGLSMYLLTLLSDHPSLSEFLLSPDYQHYIHGNDKDFLTSRVSYKLDLHGPSIVVQSGCATSLVAVHLACQDLLSYRCDQALAGGVNVYYTKGYHAQEGGPASTDGHCRAFDAQATGSVYGSGIGVVLLKRLSDALADGDHIEAVIKGSAVNNDGALKVGYTIAGIDGQSEVVLAAQTVAGVEPETISYIETHGTGTPVGDTIEIAALTQAFRTGTQAKQFCAIGSVKTNVGHLDISSGITGLIKTVQALKHQQLPPSLHFEQPNPEIDFANSPFYVNTELRPWRTNGHPRRAGVSSLATGGTSVHVILEEAHQAVSSGSSRPWQLLLLSARTPEALEQMCENLAVHLRMHPEYCLADVAYTLHVGRKPFEVRRALVCRTADDAVRLLETDMSGQGTSGYASPHISTVFLFPDQGTQRIGMGKELYETEDVFREYVDQCAGLLRSHHDIDLFDVLYPTSEASEEAARKLNQTCYAQPALFVIEYAMAQMLIAWGITPQSMIGYNLGEYVAACLAGVFTLEDALWLVVQRSKLMQQVHDSAMLEISLPASEVEPLLNGQLDLVAINTPQTCVVAGELLALETLQKRLMTHDVECHRLYTAPALHSAVAESALALFATSIGQLELHPPQIPFISNITGTWVDKDQVTTPTYWVEHLRATVQFSEGMGALLNETSVALLEVGPGEQLSTLARQHPHFTTQHMALPLMAYQPDVSSDWPVLLESLGAFWVNGGMVPANLFYQGQRRLRYSLPTYPFERQSYCIETIHSMLYSIPTLVE